MDTLINSELTFDNLNRRVGAVVRSLRNRNVLTQEQLAECSGLSVNYIGDIENGRKNVSLKVLFQLSVAFKMPLDELISYLYKGGEAFMVELETIKKAYSHWKGLNAIIANDMDSRKVNLPEAISENLACYALGLTRNMDKSGDATDENGSLIEIKATANFNSDLTSFSPNTHFDNLIFVRMNLQEDKAYIYDLGINWQEFSTFKVNKTQTVADQQKDGRRPRLQLIKYIEEHDIQPTKVVSMR